MSDYQWRRWCQQGMVFLSGKKRKKNVTTYAYIKFTCCFNWLSTYCRIMDKIAFSERRWNLYDLIDFVEWLIDDDIALARLPSYSMICLTQSSEREREEARSSASLFSSDRTLNKYEQWYGMSYHLLIASKTAGIVHIMKLIRRKMKRSKSIEKARANLVSDMSMWQYSRDTNSKSVNWKKNYFSYLLNFSLLINV